jgi:anti-sigma B factor antagonist
VEEGPVFDAAVERADGGMTQVKVSGELDLLTAPELQATLEPLQAEGVDIELDLSELEFIDSTGVHLVLQTYQASRRDGWELVLKGATEEVRRAFELVGLLDRLPFRDQGQSSS